MKGQPKKLTSGSFHILRNRLSGRESKFEWVGDAWSTPGTGYGSRPESMHVLGWEYARPVDQVEGSAA